MQDYNDTFMTRAFVKVKNIILMIKNVYFFFQAHEALVIGEVPIGCVFVGENDQVRCCDLFR